MKLVVVLNRPQNLVNVAGVIRAMKNFGLPDLRVSDPEEEIEPRRITGIAHGSDDVIKRLEIFDDLDAAIADCTFVAGMTARQRAAKRNMLTPREAATHLLEAAEEGPAALVLGREDRGLTNDELDRCHRVVTIPTSSEYAALNLSHAFAVMAYELFLARTEVQFRKPRRESEPAKQEDLEDFFSHVDASLHAVEFFKTRNTSHIMRTVREVAHRANMDTREVNLFKAMCIEVVKYLKRMGIR